MGMGCRRHAPAVASTARERDNCTGAGWDPGPVCAGAENLSLGFYPRTVQLVACRYTDKLTRPTKQMGTLNESRQMRGLCTDIN